MQKITKTIDNMISNNSSRELHHRIVPRQLENIGFDRKISKERYLFPKKDRKLLMI